MKILVLLVQTFFTFGIGILGQDVPTLNVNNVLQILQIVQKLDTKMEAFDTNLESMKEEVLQLNQRMELIDENLQAIDDKMTSLDDNMSSFNSKVTSHDEMISSTNSTVTSHDEMISSTNSKMTFIEDNISSLNGTMLSVEDKIIVIHDLLLNTQEQVSNIQPNLCEERDIQSEIARNTCTKSQVENLQHLLATDECLDGIHNCSDSSTCQNTLIGFRCTCHSGYSGDGVNCQDINECATGTHNCSSPAFCSNSDGGFECSCFPGYTGDGFYCRDIDECADQDDACDVHSDCTNTGGSFNCLCHSGYTGDGVSSCTAMCEEPSQFIRELGCVIPVKETLTWDEAQTNCQDSFGGRLLMLTTQEQLNKLMEHFEDFFGRLGENNWPFVGLQMKWSQAGGGEGGYPIDPNSPLWGNGQPNRGTEECVVTYLTDTPNLHDYRCTNRKTSLCQKE